jgi:hypothetical protein
MIVGVPAGGLAKGVVAGAVATLVGSVGGLVAGADSSTPVPESEFTFTAMPIPTMRTSVIIAATNHGHNGRVTAGATFARPVGHEALIMGALAASRLISVTGSASSDPHQALAFVLPAMG